MEKSFSNQQRALISNIEKVPSWLDNDTLCSFYKLAIEQVTSDYNDDPIAGLPADAHRVLRGGARLEQEIVKRGISKNPVIIHGIPYSMEDLAKFQNIEY